MIVLQDLFGTNKPIIGVIHLLALPGSPRWAGDMDAVLMRAEQEAAALATGGVNGIIIENFFDAPFTRGRVDTATACALTLAVKRVMSVCDLPIGVNVLRNDGLTALAIAAACGASFIRVNVLTSAMVTDQGIIEGNAYEVQSYRRQLGIHKSVKVFADVMVKHAVPLGHGMDIGLSAKDTVLRGLADCIIVSGTGTGSEPDLKDLEKVRKAIKDVPVLVGSGTALQNVNALLGIADGVIVASSLKRQGVLENPVDVERVRTLVSAVKSLA